MLDDRARRSTRAHLAAGRRMALREPTLDDVFLEPHRPRAPRTAATRTTTRATVREPPSTPEEPMSAIDRRPSTPARAGSAPRSPSAPVSGRAHDRVAQPAEHPAQPAAAGVRHDPAGDLRADVPLRVRRRDPAAPGRPPYVDFLMPGIFVQTSCSARSPPASASPTTCRRA